ncbi:MAG: hypothetical protein ACXWVG_01215 [Telluria sp.]
MPDSHLLQLLSTLGFVVVLAFFFAKVEIQIEGDAGWAANLPTWRVEEHWLLDIFWGSRAMTGYHAWVISFIALLFHLPIFLMWQWSWQLEARILAALMVFWIVEDFLWFVLNPAFGWKRFRKKHVPWHKHWIAGVPTDYWVFAAISAMLFAYSN